MRVKSWAFVHEGHIVRAEISWTLLGWNRKRLYIDHYLVSGKKGRFTSPVPISIKPGSEPVISVRFPPRRFRMDMDCEFQSAGAKYSRVETPFVDHSREPWDGEDVFSRLQMNLNCLTIFLILVPLAVLYAPLALLGG